MVLQRCFAVILSGAGITWETDCKSCLYSLCPTGYVGGGGHLSVTPVLLACACQVLATFLCQGLSPSLLVQSSFQLMSVVLADPFESGLLQRAGTNLAFPSAELQNVHHKE